MTRQMRLSKGEEVRKRQDQSLGSWTEIETPGSEKEVGPKSEFLNQKESWGKGVRMRLRFGEMKDELTLFFAQCPFEWFATLTFKNPGDQEIARKRLINWTREICLMENLQVGFIAVFNQIKRGHLHALMIGRNKSGKTLLDVSENKWAEKWGDNALIKIINNLHGVSAYLSNNVSFGNPDKSNIFFYNQNLLEKNKKPSSLKGEPMEINSPALTKNTDQGSNSLSYFKVDDILSDRKYPRKSTESPESLKSLAECIKAYGLFEPILAQKDELGKIHLLDGNRRLQAAKMAGLEKIPVLFLNAESRLNPYMIHLIKHSFRKDLSALEEAEVLKELMGGHQFSFRVLSLMTGKSEKELKDLIIVGSLPDIVKEGIRRYFGYVIVPASTLIRIAKMEGTDYDKFDELTRFIHRIRRPPKEIIKDKVDNLKKILDGPKKKDIPERDLQEVKGGLEELKHSIDKFHSNASPPEAPGTSDQRFPPYYFKLHPKSRSRMSKSLAGR